jgi:hypothetical protein
LCENKICVGKKLNEDCEPDALVECDSGLFCSKSSKKCVEQLIENEDCHSHVDVSIKDPRLLPEGSNFMTMCRGGYMCMGNEDIRRCMPFRGGAVGNFCNFTLNGHYECEFGLQCHKKQYKCVEHSVFI